MTEEQNEIRSINWTDVFSFTQIFKGWKMAIHPSKIALSTAALTMLFLLGWAMDGIWGYIGGSYARPGEIAMHAQASPAEFDLAIRRDKEQRLMAAAGIKADAINNSYGLQDYDAARSEAAKSFLPPKGVNHLENAFRKKLDEMNAKEKDFKVGRRDDILADANSNGISATKILSDAEAASSREDDKIDTLVDQAAAEADNVVKNLATGKAEAQETLATQKKLFEYAKTLRRAKFALDSERIRGAGIASSFVDYEWSCLRGALSAAFHGNFISGLRTYPILLDRKAPRSMATNISEQAPILDVANPAEPPGFLLWTLMGSRGVIWLVQEHWVYATLYLLIALAICAWFGGAVNRIAALQFAREEKISISQALKFSTSKFLSFFMAPVIPVLIILVLGLLLFLGGLLGSIPFVGEIVMAVLLGLALILGFAIAFLLVGLASGFLLMYPTIAVEGSDSFDAISRSYSYVFARPWRAILYAVVAALYGAITYTFVRIFAYIALTATHTFVSMGVFGGGSRMGPGADKLDVIWSAPTFDSLFGRFNWAAMNGTEKTAAFIIGIWVFLVAVTVTAYLVSYAASATTIIYFLLRRKVDATDLDDVYMEESDDEDAAAPAPEGATQVPVTAEPAAGTLDKILNEKPPEGETKG